MLARVLMLLELRLAMEYGSFNTASPHSSVLHQLTYKYMLIDAELGMWTDRVE